MKNWSPDPHAADAGFSSVDVLRIQHDLFRIYHV